MNTAIAALDGASRRRVARVTVLLAVVALVVCGCTNPLSRRTSPEAPRGEGMTLSGDFRDGGPGSLLSATTLPAVDLRVRAVTTLAARFTYRSTSGDGSETIASGSVFVPRDRPPADGWPILAFGHPTTGVQEDCAPSLDPNLLGSATTIVGLVKAGYVVVMTDYEGLGVEGTHHRYLDSTAAGVDVIDSVRAVRKFVSDTAEKWAALGVSQGGQAVWAANELTRGYGSAGDLVAVASLSPAAKIEGLADAAAAGTLTPDQKPAYQWMLVGLSGGPDPLELDEYRRGVVRDEWAVLSSCRGPLAAQRETVIPKIGEDDLKPANVDATNRLRGRLANMSLPKAPTMAPMLVTYGGADQLIAPVWTDEALREGCALGDVIDVRFAPEKSHGDVDLGGALGWLKERFDDVPPTNSCPSLLPPPVTGDE